MSIPDWVKLPKNAKSIAQSKKPTRKTYVQSPGQEKHLNKHTAHMANGGKIEGESAGPRMDRMVRKKD